MTRPTAFVAFGLFMLCCVMVFCATAFARAQSIWVDESTQLSGLTLGFGEQVLWLLGRIDHPFTVPADRMPPVSYWLGKTWASIFGLTEGSMRSLGIMMALCAMPALFFAGRLVGGMLGGLFAVAFLFTSPSFVIQTVEIRAYPIFFCLSAWATYLFVRIVTDEKAVADNRTMVGLAAILVIMSYTHFYGIVASGFFFLTLLVDHLYTRKPIKMLLMCCAAGVILLIGVLPFVATSVSMTASSTESGGLQLALADAVRLVFRLVSSPVLFANPVTLSGALACIALLGLCLVYFILHPPERAARKNLLIIMLPLVVALIILTLIRTQISSFAILAPHYNLWLLPVVSVTFAFAFALQNLWARRVVLIAAISLIAVQLSGLTTLMAHKTLYSHGPAEAIAEHIIAPNTTLVLHDAASLWGQSYFPLNYLTKGQMAQWLSYPDGQFRRIDKSGLRDIADPQVELRSFEQVLRVQTAEFSSQQLADIVRNPSACRLESAHLLTGQDTQNIRTFCAYFGASYTISEPE